MVELTYKYKVKIKQEKDLKIKKKVFFSLKKCQYIKFLQHKIKLDPIIFN